MLLDAYNYLYIAVTVIILYTVAAYRQKYQKYQTLTSSVPTVYGLPLLGILYKIFPVKKFLYVLQSYFTKLKSWTYCAWIGTEPFFITIDPDVLKDILSSDDFLDKSRSLYTPVDSVIPHGLITSRVPKWRHDRKLMNLSFSHKIITSFMPVFKTGTQMAIRKLDAMVGTGEREVFEVLKRTFFNMALETTIGITMKEGVKAHETIVRGFNFMIEKIAKDAMLSTLHLGFLVRTPKYYSTKRFIRQYVETLIKNKYDLKDNNHNCDSIASKTATEDDGIKSNSEIFINQALSFQERGLFELDDVISQTKTVIAGSFETVSTTIYSILVMLAMHPQVQQKLYADILQILPESDVDLGYEHLKQLPYMDMVIDETLRLLPSIPLIGRQATRDTHLKCQIPIPQGIQVMIPIFLLHRRKDIWGAEANFFNPNNFSSENVNKRHPFAYIPFSKGARNCIGMRYAGIALRVMLIELLRHFEFSTTFKYENIVFLDNISLRYEREPLLRVDRRL